MAIHRSPKQQLEERRAFVLGRAEQFAESSKKLLRQAAEDMAEEHALKVEADELAAAIEVLS